MKELYDQAVKSIKTYKDNNEELTDFDAFMDEIEEEYKKTLNN